MKNELGFTNNISDMKSYSEELVFIGKIIKVKSNRILICENDEKFVVVNVKFINIETNEKIWIEYQIIRTNPDIESVKIDKESLFNWTFRIGNIYNVKAKKLDGKYIEKIYSIQELYFELAD